VSHYGQAGGGGGGGVYYGQANGGGGSAVADVPVNVYRPVTIRDPRDVAAGGGGGTASSQAKTAVAAVGGSGPVPRSRRYTASSLESSRGR
jgi:hypothetical protein